MDDELTLIGQEPYRDQAGVWKTHKTERDVFCKTSSITRQEYYEAGRNGMNPEFKFMIFSGDYNGESLCVFHGKSYSIYRSYLVPGSDYMELYAERKGGTNGKENAD
jgi:hypothetical protein